ncbi:MAG: TetR/AcrR family transcriptional regulator [Lacrimispora sp.]|uniref:TetR/AcrR family transcriptional regulator n=1 Tax=Lacrimispora sp. TaxID=2719234 RepID=UPI0039E431FF
MMESKIDKRIIKSQAAIQSTFLEMLADRGFDEITVKDIADKANISRKTFYLHYVDKYDLMDRIVDQRLMDLKDICELKKDMKFVEGTVIWFQYFERHQAFFSALFMSQSTTLFRKRLLDFMADQLIPKIKKDNGGDYDLILKKFLSMAVLGILESYFLNELGDDLEQVAKRVGRLVEQNLLMNAQEMPADRNEMKKAAAAKEEENTAEVFKLRA